MADLEFDGLTCRYGDVVALDGLTFNVPAGEVFGFLGPNGSGKTTAMRAVFGLVGLQAGKVRWRGGPIDRDERRRFGYMPEERGLYPGMVIVEQLQFLGQLHGMSAVGARASAMRWLDRLGVADRADGKVESLSLGNQQRVQLASALVHEPDALILDEPLSGLDPVGIDAVGAVLVEQARAGRCVLFSSHQLDLVENLCESVAIIDRGRLVVEGRVDDLASSGRRRLVVSVEGDDGGTWLGNLDGVRIDQVEGGNVHVVLDDTTDPQAVLAAAIAAGPVTQFGFERRRLSEVFREAVQRT